MDAIYDELALAELKACLANPYKNQDIENMLLFENFKTNTYEQSEIIVKMGPYATVHDNTVRSLSKGQCFTITFTNKVEANNMNLSVALKKGFDYDIYLNSAG